LNGCLVL